ncbi:MAG: hypothetical protein SP4CHLAM5_09660 [Chlamydiia bacterium]|nr:hypothetical protein [Chlamydiia bacterium]MCH9618824.1 hypothetical protein [Chlamydiia bacterium]MCH9624374.1 hypothetical protein [Chlamydiia bacterium]
MKDEFNKIIDLFSLESEEKEKRLDEIFQLSMSFIEKYKHVQSEGTEREKADVVKKLLILKEKISLETKASEEALSLSKEEIKELSSDQENFTKEQWELLQKTKQSLTQEQLELQQHKKEALNKQIKSNPTKGSKKKTKRGRSSWLKS